MKEIFKCNFWKVQIEVNDSDSWFLEKYSGSIHWMALSQISKWVKEWELSFELPKSEVVYFVKFKFSLLERWEEQSEK